jgi:hypothetical protein
MSPRPVFNPVRLPSYAPFVGGSFGKPGPFFNNPSRVGGSDGRSPDEGG